MIRLMSYLHLRFVSSFYQSARPLLSSAVCQCGRVSDRAFRAFDLVFLGLYLYVLGTSNRNKRTNFHHD